MSDEAGALAAWLAGAALGPARGRGGGGGGGAPPRPPDRRPERPASVRKARVRFDGCASLSSVWLALGRGDDQVIKTNGAQALRSASGAEADAARPVDTSFDRPLKHQAPVHEERQGVSDAVGAKMIGAGSEGALGHGEQAGAPFSPPPETGAAR